MKNKSTRNEGHAPNGRNYRTPEELKNDYGTKTPLMGQFWKSQNKKTPKPLIKKHGRKCYICKSYVLVITKTGGEIITMNPDRTNHNDTCYEMYKGLINKQNKHGKKKTENSIKKQPTKKICDTEKSLRVQKNSKKKAKKIKTKCTRCKTHITFTKNKNGKWQPFNLDGELHFDSCKGNVTENPLEKPYLSHSSSN